MSHQVVDTYFHGKVRVLRPHLIPHLLPALQADGTYSPGPRLTDRNWFPKGSVAVQDEWHEDCWPYFVVDNESGPVNSPGRYAHVARPLTMAEAAAIGIYAFGEWRPEVGDGGSVVACGCASVVVRQGWPNPNKSAPVVYATAQARVHVGIRAHVRASGYAQVYVSGAPDAPVEVDASGTSVVFVRGTHVTVRTSERATVLYVAADPPIKIVEEKEDERTPSDEPTAIGSVVATRAFQRGWSYADTKPIRDAIKEGAIPAPSEEDARVPYVRDGWRAIDRPAIPEDEPCPPLATLLRLRGRDLLRVLEEVNQVGHAHLPALVPWITSLVVSGSHDVETNQAAARALCAAAAWGNEEARQVLLGLMTPTVHPKILATLFAHLPAWPEMQARILAFDLTVHHEEAAEGFGKHLRSISDTDRVVEVIRRTIANNLNRGTLVEAMLCAALQHDEENLAAREILRGLILRVLPSVQDEGLMISLARTVAARTLAPAERNTLVQVLRSVRTPWAAAKVALLLHAAPNA